MFVEINLGCSEYGMATERTCLVRGPSDSEERCAPTLRGNTRVSQYKSNLELAS
jgi:hypothetical protein